MKIEKKEIKKECVIVYLEDQDEVNQLFAIVNFAPLGEAMGTDFIKKLYNELHELMDGGYGIYHDRLDSGMIRREG